MNIQGAGEGISRILFFALSLAGVWVISTNKWADKWLREAIKWYFSKYTPLDFKDYANLLHLGEIGEWSK